jgi:hypothetical protein
MRDLMNSVHVKPAFAPKAAVTDTTAQVSTSCNLQGFSSCMLAFITGTNADADVTYTVLIEDSADDSSYAAVDDAYLNGTEVLAAFQFDDDGEVRKIGYTGGKQYVRATITPVGNTGNFFLGGVWVLGHPSRQATANPPQ